ncbi:alpha/beta hydrolase [Streptomyces sp. PTM05]|uniref:Alpha/beta hydrolase n=1 Tax=Streptantibioticus parmotrematis TaxID=2873249 RepID=A0ABS7QNJ0_9ACTN|nr:alpha/beta fold hydrolase [Streptantibioticus parmotrematis]MBY8884738.1 alpha/beta hydrolase [Streptantibioticus parmotrematis]
MVATFSAHVRGAARLGYIRLGAGPPLLLVQGTAATYLHWGRRLLSSLAESFDVVAYNHRGVGDSAPVSGPFTVPELADDAAGLLDALGWRQVHVVGVSMGGLVAQELVLRHPARVESLFLGCTHTGGTGSKSVVPEALASAIVEGDPAATLRNVFRLGVKDPVRVRPGAWEEYRGAALAQPVDPWTTTLQISASATHTTADRLRHICVPTHVVHGDGDRVVSIETGRRLAAGIHGSDFTSLAAGHLFWLEQPERVAALIRAGAPGLLEGGSRHS